MKLDLKDRKIIYQLDINSQQTNSEIAKKVGLSKQVVGFRISRIMKHQLLLNFYTVIDISRLGFTVHKNFLRLQNLDSKKEQELISWLKNHRNVVWVASCEGMFDLAFGTWATNVEFLNKTLTELNTQFGDYINERQIATILKGEYFTRDYLTSAKTELRKSFFGSIPSKVKMDEKDWQILKLISSNPRTPFTEIAKQINLSADAIAKRIRNLEESGVTRHYNIIPNESKWPYLHHKILISLKNITEKKKNTLKEHCRSHPNIVYVVDALGPWDFEIDTESESPEKFRSIMMEIKTNFSDIIKDYSILHIYQVHKYNFCPSVPELIEQS